MSVREDIKIEIKERSCYFGCGWVHSDGNRAGAYLTWTRRRTWQPTTVTGQYLLHTVLISDSRTDDYASYPLKPELYSLLTRDACLRVGPCKDSMQHQCVQISVGKKTFVNFVLIKARGQTSEFADLSTREAFTDNIQDKK